MWNVLRVDAAARDSAVIRHAGHTPHWADIRLFLFFLLFIGCSPGKYDNG